MDIARRMAMSQLGNGLTGAGHHEDAMFVQEAELSMQRRLGSSGLSMLALQSNIANTYQTFGRSKEALQMRRDVYLGCLKLKGDESIDTVRAACNYAAGLSECNRFEETKALLRTTMPVARRVLGESHDFTFTMRGLYAQTLREDDCATLDNLRESVTTLEETERTARRVLGGTHPMSLAIGVSLRLSQAKLGARETPSVSS